VLAIWIAAAIAIAAAALAIGEQTSDDLTLPGSGSTRATDLLDRGLPKEANGSNPIALEPPSGKLTSAANERVVDATVKSVERAPHVIRAVSPLTQRGADALSRDKRIGYLAVTLDVGPGDLDDDEASTVLDAASPARDAGFSVAAGGYLGQELSQPSTHDSEAIGIAAAVIILLLAFGTAVAMALPITTAILGLVGGLGLIALLSGVVEIPSVAPTLGTMIGLGVGIDYSLFIVTRYRERLHDGVPVDEAIARATGSAGGAVVFAGGTVVIALLSLVLADIPIVSALGYSAAIVVAVAVAAAVTLLPAILSILGERIESLRVPHFHARARDGRAHGWERWARGVTRRPWPAMLAAVALLVVLALPTLDIRLGQEDVGELPESTTARQSYDLLSKGFGPGANGPFLIAVHMRPPAHPDRAKLNQLKQKEQRQESKEQQAVDDTAEQLTLEGVPADEAQSEAEQQVEAQSGQSQAQQQKLEQQKKFLRSTASDPRLVKLEHRVGGADDVKSVSAAKVNSRGDVAVFTATPKSAPSSEATTDLVGELRDDVIPKALAGTQVSAYVGGTTAANVDLAERIGDKLPQVIGVVVALSFILLLAAFRSILVPLTAALMNLLSVFASYGVLTAVFEKGWGAGLIGLDHPIPIESFVPLLMFAILFGLSMDYQVFLVSRIKECRRTVRDEHEAVVEGLASSGRVITSAALIMVCVFTSFVLNGDPTVKQFGVGLAAAIAIDATVVRCFLVPAAMTLLGRANWWLPGWLERHLPRLGIESDEETMPTAPASSERAARPAQ
jgi:putative drug exporter of the RND superfamily